MSTLNLHLGDCFDLDAWELDVDYFDQSTQRVVNHFKQMNAFQEKPIINIIR